MKFNISSQLSYEVYSPTAFIFSIQAAKNANQQIISESLLIPDSVNYSEFSLNENRFIKVLVEKDANFTISYAAEVEVGYKIIDDTILSQSIPVFELNTSILPYLLPSRNCQSDKLDKLAFNQFGRMPTAYSKVLAINDWINSNIDYISGTTDNGTSAFDTVTQRQGVCKDFAHLGIALCRALDIPARYITTYAYQLYPQDFHACYEAYIGGHWIIFDPTGLVPINGLVKIATGKDATELAVATFFGNTFCTYMNVQCNTADNQFQQFVPSSNRLQALAYE